MAKEINDVEKSSVADEVASPVQEGTSSESGSRYRIETADEKLNFVPHVIADPVVTGRQVLETADKRPAEEYLVLQILQNGALEELRLDETTDLRSHGSERFIVFRSDRSFRFEVDDRRFEWGDAEVKGVVVKMLIGADPQCTGLWLERREEPDLFINDEDVVHLNGEGVERLRTAQVFRLCIEGQEFIWLKPSITTEEIIKLGGWDPKQGVQEINLATNEARTLKPGEVVDLKELKNFAKKIGWRRG